MIPKQVSIVNPRRWDAKERGSRPWKYREFTNILAETYFPAGVCGYDEAYEVESEVNRSTFDVQQNVQISNS